MTVLLSAASLVALPTDAQAQNKTFTASNLEIAEGNSGTTTLMVRVDFSEPITVAQTMVVRIVQSGKTVTHADYRHRNDDSRTFSFRPGHTSLTFPVWFYGDTTPEADEFLPHTISGIGFDTKAFTVTVLDDDTPGVRISKTALANMAENDGSASASYTVSLRKPPTGTVTVTPTEASGQVTISPSSLSFGPGEGNVKKSFTVTPVDDSVSNGPRTVQITHAASGTGYDMPSVGTVAVTITDDEPVTPPVLTITGASVTEGNTGTATQMRFTLRLDKPASKAFDIKVDSSRPGSSELPNAANFAGNRALQDVQSPGSEAWITFGVGDTVKTYDATIIGDNRIEPDGRFCLSTSYENVNGPAQVSEFFVFFAFGLFLLLG